MRNELQKFNETVDILVKAYLNDRLKHEDCTACVVGNLCGGDTIWKFLFMTNDGVQKPFHHMVQPDMYFSILHFHEAISFDQLVSRAKVLCASTGYAIDELKRIEYTFEMCPHGSNDDEWMLNGLMAVVDALADIHGVDLSVKESAKTLFVKC